MVMTNSRHRVLFSPDHWHWSVATAHPGLFLLGLIVVALIGWWTYQRQAATPGLKRAMAIIRAAVLALVVLLLAQPLMVTSRTVHTESTIAVWLDSSLSMTLRDPYHRPAMRRLLAAYRQWRTHRAARTPGRPARRPSRYELAVWQLRRAARTWLGRLARRQQIAIFTGGAHARWLGVAAGPAALQTMVARLARRHPTGDSTNLAAVVHGIFQQLAGRPISALVLLTDGRSTSAGSPALALAAARRRAVGIFALPLGQVHTPFNLALTDGQAPRHAFVHDPVAVRGVLRLSGSAEPRRVQVELLRARRGGRLEPLADRSLLLPAGGGRVPVELMFHPRHPGRYRLLLRTPRLPGEITYRDNRSGLLRTTVVNSKINILYVDGYPRWEYRYLRQDLRREPTTRLGCLLLSTDNRFAQEGNIPMARFPDTARQLDRYDVLLLGDVDPNYFSQAQEKLILHFVGAAGGGFGMIAGPDDAPRAYRGTRLAALLPVRPGRPGDPALAFPPPAPFHLHLTAAGRASPIFQFFDSRRKSLWQVGHLSPLYWFEPVAGVAPGGVVLADNPAHLIHGRPAPLLVFGRYGAGRTMFAAFDDTWRWRYYHGAPLYQSYWLQIVRQLAWGRVFRESSHSAFGLTLRSAAPQGLVGHRFPLSLRVGSAALADQMPRQVRLRVRGPGPALSVSLVPEPRQRQRYTGALTLWRPGHYTLSAASRLPAPLPPLRLQITQPNLEFRNLRADVPALTRLARATGGKVIPLPQAATLAALIPDRGIQTVQRRSHALWNQPLALALLVALLTAEWILRKRAGLI